MNVLPLIFMALINAYRRRIKRVNSQPLNEHKTQCGAETKLWGRHKSKYKPQSLRSIFRFPLFPCHEIKPGNNETQSGSQTISDQGIGHPQTENPNPLENLPLTTIPGTLNPISGHLPSSQHSLYNHLTQR